MNFFFFSFRRILVILRADVKALDFSMASMLLCYLSQTHSPAFFLSVCLSVLRHGTAARSQSCLLMLISQIAIRGPELIAQIAVSDLQAKDNKKQKWSWLYSAFHMQLSTPLNISSYEVGLGTSSEY